MFYLRLISYGYVDVTKYIAQVNLRVEAEHYRRCELTQMAKVW